MQSYPSLSRTYSSTFTDVNYFTEDVSVNICAMQNGNYDACAKEDPTSTPSTSLVIPPPSISTPSATLVSDAGSKDDEGLAGWAISFIITLVLVFVCCVGYAIAVVYLGVANCFDDCFRDRDDTKKAHNNIYWDDLSWNDRSRDDRSRDDRSRDDRSRDDRSRLSRQSRRMLAIENGNSSATPKDHDSFSIGASRYSQSVNSYVTKHKISRDPTMYIPGHEDKPDPDSENWSPPSNPKHDPTLYFDEVRPRKDPQLKLTRDPTMYIDGHRETDMYTIDDSTVEEAHNDENGLDKHSGRVTRDPSYFDMKGSEFSFYDDDNSKRVGESRSIISPRSKKTTKRMKSTKGGSEQIQNSLDSADWNTSSSDFIYEPKKRASLRASLVSLYNDSASINDDHANSFPDGGARYGVKDTRQTKSFYK